MTRVTTAGNYSSVLANLMAAQSRQVEAGNQMASEKKAQNLKGYARDAETMTAMRGVQARVAGYLDQASALSDKLTVQDLALTHVADAAGGARQALQNALASDTGDTLMQEITGAFADAVQGLNSKSNGRYLFAGGQIDVAPFAASGLSDLTAAPSVAGLFKNDGFKATSTIDDGVTVQTSFLASDLGQGLMEAFKAIQAFNEGPDGPLSGPLTDAQRSFLSSQIAVFGARYDELTNAAGLNGLNQNRVESVESDLKGRRDTLEGMFSDLSSVDMADAVSRLQQAQMSVQAAAQVFSTLQSSSLLNVLSR